MSTKSPAPTQNLPLRKASTRLSTSSGKGSAGAVTHETLADDIAAFRKSGGKIEVLGHTPLRSVSASRASGKAANAAPAANTASKTNA